MKRIISVFCALACALICLSSCRRGEGNVEEGAAESENNNANKENYTLYLGVHQEHNASEGRADFAATFAAVICDEKGIIVDCVFDEAEHKVSLEAGAVESERDIRSKNEQGLEYSMKSASSIGKEWYEQARHFADFLVGKTLDEADDVDGGEAELMAGCTININGFKEALEESDDEENAVTFQSESVPEAALAMVNSTDGSKDATDGTDGVAAFKSTCAAVAKNGSKIAAANIEETEAAAYFDMSGLIISFEKEEGKRDMGYSYGMKSVSGIGLEWFEQVRNFEKYIVSLTPSQVAVIDMNGDYSADEALLAGCTIKITDFVKAISKISE